jgi:hypothetical protein
VERSPEKAGVGGSIPSLATIFSISYRPSKKQFHSVSFQNFGLLGFASTGELHLRIGLDCSQFRRNRGKRESGNLRKSFNYRSEM